MRRYAMLFIAALALCPLALADEVELRPDRVSDEPLVEEVVYTASVDCGAKHEDCSCDSYREYDRTQKPANAHYNFRRGGCGGCEVVDVKCDDGCGHEVRYERNHRHHAEY